MPSADNPCGSTPTKKAGDRLYCAKHAPMVEANRRALCEVNDKIELERRERAHAGNRHIPIR
jgi:hypothetical protein